MPLPLENVPRDSLATALLRLSDDELLDQCDVDLHRVRGPGGQKRNKTHSAVRLRHRTTGLIVNASEERSQHINKARAVDRLREAIALHVRTPILTTEYAMSPLLTSVLDHVGTLKVSRRNPVYPIVLAEVFDVLEFRRGAVSDAAGALGMTTSHLVKFLEKDPKAWERINQMRAHFGLKPLRQQD